MGRIAHERHQEVGSMWIGYCEREFVREKLVTLIKLHSNEVSKLRLRIPGCL